MTKEQFVEKYQFEFMGRILAGHVEPGMLIGDYAKLVWQRSVILATQIYDELCPQPPTPTKGSKA